MSVIAVVIGSATSPGRLHRAAAEAIAWANAGGSIAIEVIDLSSAPLDVADGRPDGGYSERTAQAVASIGASDGVVVFSPTYRASIPGALKNLLDLTPVSALSAKPVGIVAMGGSDHHYLGVDRHLRDILAFFGAVVAPTSVYLTGRDFEAGEPRPDAADAVHELFRTIVTLAERLGGTDLGPPPLAAKAW